LDPIFPLDNAIPLSAALAAPPTAVIASVSSTGEQGNGSSGNNTSGSISTDGRFMAFASYASNLVSGDNNGTYDIFVHDFKTRITQRASIDSTGQEGNGPSGPRDFGQ
jgi:Tol biopolymer transport system component